LFNTAMATDLGISRGFIARSRTKLCSNFYGTSIAQSDVRMAIDGNDSKISGLCPRLPV